MCPRRSRIALRHVESEHFAQIFADLLLQLSGHWRGLQRNIVLIVEHGREISEHAGHGQIPIHVSLITIAEKGDGTPERMQQLVELILHSSDRIVVIPIFPSFGYILRVIVQACAVIAVGLNCGLYEFAEQFFVFCTRSQEPGGQ